MRYQYKCTKRKEKQKRRKRKVRTNREIGSETKYQKKEKKKEGASCEAKTFSQGTSRQ